MLFRRIRLVFVLCLLIFTFCLSAPQTRADSGRQYFPQTGHSIAGRFLQYWNGNGGLPIFGYPVSDEISETTTNGTYTVQYFERNRFEYHSENKPPYDVLLGRLGADTVTLHGVDKLPAYNPMPGPPSTGDWWFKETQHSLSGAFLQYWLAHGGLPVFGFPLTEPFTENTPQGAFTVQYFERNRFELHPEAPPAYRVLLGLLGNDAEGRNIDPDFRLPTRADVAPANATLTLTIGALAGQNLDQSGKALQPLDKITVQANMWVGPTFGDKANNFSLRLYDGVNRLYLTLPIKLSATSDTRTAADGTKQRRWNWSGIVRVGGAVGQGSAQLFDPNNARVAAVYGAYTLNATTTVQSGDPQIDRLWPQISSFLQQDRVTYYTPPGDDPRRPVTGYRSPDSAFIWLRDHVYQSRAFKYFEPEMKSVINFFLTTQKPDGSFEEYFQYEGGDVFRGRIEVEADVEYLMVMGAYTAWQATGDDAWLQSILPEIEKGLNYTHTDPLRWNKDYGLVMRAFTIDTWDFEYDPTFSGLQRTLGPDTKWSIFHGDNTGFAQAARTLATMYDHFGQADKAANWRNIGDGVMARLNALAWNGNYFTHMVHLTNVPMPPGQDEAQQLSLSNAYNLTRGVLTQAQAAATLREYMARRDILVQRAQKAGGDWKAQDMAEWFAIDKPFITGYPYGQDNYVNGGKMPLVGGALAQGAFAHGFEHYGLDILHRYSDLTAATGAGYLWYHADGTPGISNSQTIATDGWGAAEMGGGLFDGLAGVQDNTSLFRSVTLTPRWAIDGQAPGSPALHGEIAVVARYGASNGYAAYRYQYDAPNNRVILSIFTGAGASGSVSVHLLLPSGRGKPLNVTRNGQPIPFSLSTVEGSTYLDLPTTSATLQTLTVQW